MKISELTAFTPADLQDIDALMHELSATSFCNEQKLKSVIEDRNTHLYVVQDAGRIIGSACLCVAHTTEFTLGFVEAVVVSSTYRGQHIGRLLMEYLLKEARALGVHSLHLTSNPKRISANRLYRSLGFEAYDTNVYKLCL